MKELIYNYKCPFRSSWCFVFIAMILIRKFTGYGGTIFVLFIFWSNNRVYCMLCPMSASPIFPVVFQLCLLFRYQSFRNVYVMERIK